MISTDVKLKVGDRVWLTTGCQARYADCADRKNAPPMAATITGISGNGQPHFEADNGRPCWAYSCIESIITDESTQEALPEFKVGDRVLNQCGICSEYGQEETVMFVRPNELSVRNDAGVACNHEKKHFKLIKATDSEPEKKPEPASRFKVGDLVIGNKRANRYNLTVPGTIWRVVSVPKPDRIGVGYVPGITKSDTRLENCVVDADCFDLYEEKPAVEYKVGDTVRIVKRLPDNKTGLMDWKLPDGDVGRVCEIVSKDTNVHTFKLYWEGKYVGWFSPEELEKVEPTPEPRKAKTSAGVGTYAVDEVFYSGWAEGQRRELSQMARLHWDQWARYDFTEKEEPIKKGKKFMANVQDKIKVLKMTGEDKELYKAGFIDSDRDLTDQGEDALQEVLRNLARKDLVDLAHSLNEDAKDEKKAKK